MGGRETAVKVGAFLAPKTNAEHENDRLPPPLDKTNVSNLILGLRRCDDGHVVVYCLLRDHI